MTRLALVLAATAAWATACSSTQDRAPAPEAVRADDLPEGLEGLLNRGLASTGSSSGYGSSGDFEPSDDGSPEDDGSPQDWVDDFWNINQLDVTAHLDGRLRDVTLEHDTVANTSFATEWTQGGFLDIAAAAETQGGAGMLLLTLSGGEDHPLLRTGRWSYADEQFMNSTGSAEHFTYVGSCAGPALGNYPFEDPPIDYELTVEPTADPERITIDVEALFENGGSIDAEVELLLPG